MDLERTLWRLPVAAELGDLSLSSHGRSAQKTPPPFASAHWPFTHKKKRKRKNEKKL